MLQYKTRDDSSPNGKPWVFFCAAPADIAVTLPRISEEIFEFCNCAIWYDNADAPAATDRELEEAISQCAMAILPVVPGLLDPAGVVQSRLMSILRRHPMALLPILEDPNLLTAFNRCFENIQLLRRHDPDATALPYPDRLKRFLETSLLGNDLAEQVKQAFRDTVFLSYRTHDRAMILQLLQKVHADPRCRRTGIWYDQFLIPGEDFNNGIAQAILDSDLFLLALTHNMVGSESYVTQKEYPLAQETGKEILPVLLEDVDPGQTSRRFPKMPEPADIHRAIQALGDRSDKAGSSQDSPEQDYLLAMAYLHGLHAERSVSIALELLESSAEGGYAPAALRLANIRQQEQTGEGCRLWQIRWLRKYAELTEKDYRADPSEATVKSYADALDRLSEILFSPETQDESFQYSAQAAALLEQHGILSDCAQLLVNYGVRLSRAGRNRDGLQVLMRALGYYSELSRQDPDYVQSNLARLAQCYYNIGFAAENAENPTLAKLGFQQAVSHYLRLYRASPENYALPLAESYGNLGAVCAQIWDRTQKDEDYDQAEKYQGTAIRLLNDWIERDPVVYEPVFARCCVGAAALFSRRESDLDRAQMFLDLAIPTLEHYEALYPGTYLESVAMAIVNRAIVHFRRKNYPAARADYEASLPLFRQMPWNLMMLAKTHWNLGNTYAEENDVENALKCYAAAVEVYEGDAVQGAETSRDYTECCHNYANLLYVAGDYRGALDMVHKTLALYRNLQKGDTRVFADRIAERQRFAAHLESLL